MHSPDENQLWCPGQSLWSLITEHVSQAELLKIHAALGDPLVDMYTEVHSEAEIWHKMWQDSCLYGNHPSSSKTRLEGFPLSDPPAVKELKRAEVKLLLETLKERASYSERDSEDLLQRYEPETLNYVLGHQETAYHRSSNHKNSDTFNSRPSSCCSVTSSAKGEIEAVKDKLNITEIHRVITRLRCVLLEECEALNKKTKHLKEKIKLKCMSQCHSKEPEPSLSDLKELRAAIQTDLELLPSSLAALSSAPVLRLKKSCRRPAVPSSDSRLASAPKSGFRQDLLPIWQPKPRPPLYEPPNRNLSVRTLGLHSFASASNKPACSIKMDSGLKARPKAESQADSNFSAEPDLTGSINRTCSRFHTNSEENSASLKINPSTKCCNNRPSSDFEGSEYREKRFNFTPSPPSSLGQLSDLGSSSSADRSVCLNGKIKADDRKNNCISGRNSALTGLQKNMLGKTSGAGLISGTLDQSGGKKSSRSEINQRRQGSFSIKDDSPHYPKGSETCTQAQSAKMNIKTLNSSEKLQQRKLKQTQRPLLELFPQPVCPVQDCYVNIFQ